MPTPEQFASRMRELGSRIVKNVDDGFRATALAIDQTVVLATPVDTGRARSNWRVSAEKNSGVFEAFAEGKAGSTAGENTQQALDDGAAVIDGLPPDTHTLYISNNLPYIQPLNDGSSAQAPAGFVEQAVQAGLDVVKKLRVLG